MRIATKLKLKKITDIVQIPFFLKKKNKGASHKVQSLNALQNHI